MFAALTMTLSLAAQNNNEEFQPNVQVNGRAERMITPNEFDLMIVINERDSKGKITVEQQQKEMVSTLKRLGVDVEKQLTFANLSSEFFKKKTSVATAKYQLRLNSAADVTRVWQALNDLDISNVSILKVGHSDIEQLKSEVRREAIINARECATQLAEAIGQKIGPCFYIYDSNYDVTPRFYNNMAVSRAKAYADGAVEEATEDEPALEFKNLKLEYSVQAKFVLKL